MESWWEVLGIIGVLLLIAEVFAPGFVAFPAGAAFLLTAGVALFTNNAVVLLVALAFTSALAFFVVNKFIRPLVAKNSAPTAVDAMVGKVGRVTTPIEAGKRGGVVALYGDRWQAEAEVSIDTEAEVEIVSVEGNRVTVKPVE